MRRVIFFLIVLVIIGILAWQASSAHNTTRSGIANIAMTGGPGNPELRPLLDKR